MSEDRGKLKKTELLSIAREMGLSGLSRLRRAEILDLIERAEERAAARGGAAATKKASAKKATKKTTAKKTTKKASTKKIAAAKKTSTKKASTKKTAAKKTTAKAPDSKKTRSKKAGSRKAATAEGESAAAGGESEERKPPRRRPSRAAAEAAIAAEAERAARAARTAEAAKIADDEAAAQLRVVDADVPSETTAQPEAPSPVEAPQAQVEARTERVDPSPGVAAPEPAPTDDLLTLDDIDAADPDGGGGSGDGDGSGELIDNVVTLLPREPGSLHAFWTLDPEYCAAARDAGGEDFALRLYDVSDQPTARGGLDAHAPVAREDAPAPGASECTVRGLESGRSFICEVGYRAGDGQWLPLARSQAASTLGATGGAARGDTRFGHLAFDTPLSAPSLAHEIPSDSAFARAVGQAAEAALAGGAALPPSAREALAALASSQSVGGHPSSQALGAPSSQAPASQRLAAQASAVLGVPSSAAVSSAALSSAALSSPGAPGAGPSSPALSSPGIAPARPDHPRASRDAPEVDIRLGEHAFDGLPLQAIPTDAGVESDQRKPLLRTTAELVVAGRTAPGTVLSIGGRAVAVGPDGGFSLRVPLLEGTADLAIEAQAESGERENLRLWFGQITDRP